jgi:hypothetical protein
MHYRTLISDVILDLTNQEKIDKLEYILHKLKVKQHGCINGDGVVGCTRVLLGS